MNQFSVSFEKPKKDSSLSTKIPWLMVSKAADRSTGVPNTTSWRRSIDLRISFVTKSKVVSTEWCFLYADCLAGCCYSSTVITFSGFPEH